MSPAHTVFISLSPWMGGGGKVASITRAPELVEVRQDGRDPRSRLREIQEVQPPSASSGSHQGKQWPPSSSNRPRPPPAPASFSPNSCNPMMHSSGLTRKLDSVFFHTAPSSAASFSHWFFARALLNGTIDLGGNLYDCATYSH